MYKVIDSNDIRGILNYNLYNVHIINEVIEI